MRISLLLIALLALLLAPAAQAATSIEEAIIGALPWERGFVEVEDVSVPGLDGAKAFKVEFPKRPTGPGKVAFTVRQAGREGVVWGTARVRVYRDAVVALRPLRARMKVTAEDLKLSRVELQEASEGFSEVADAAGLVAMRPVQPGTVVKREYVRPEAIVRKGQRVRLSVVGSSLMIRSKGTASADGTMGSTVAVRTASGKEVLGKVTGPGEITVNF